MLNQIQIKRSKSGTINQEDKNSISYKIKKQINDVVKESESYLQQHMPKKSKNHKKGFGSMTPAKIAEIAKKGGKARAKQLGHAGFVELGRKGGIARAKQLGHAGFVELGRKGGAARATSYLNKSIDPQNNLSNQHPIMFKEMTRSYQINKNIDPGINKQENLTKYTVNAEKIRQKQFEIELKKHVA
ncbi:MAG: KGG domain-containing protein [Janthinobacterium lividum]